MKKTMLACTLAVALLFTACGGKKQVDDYDNMKVEASETDRLEAAEIPAHIKSVITGGSGTLSIDADVVAYGAANAKVYSEKLLQIDDDRLKQMAEKLFDDGKYEIMKPYCLYTDEELEAEGEFWREQRQENGEHGRWDCDARMLDVYSEKSAREDGSALSVDEEKEGKVIYELSSGSGPIWFRGNCYEDGITCGVLRGTVKGRFYELSYVGYKGMYQLDFYACGRQYNYDVYTTDYYKNNPLFGENICSAEDARATAEQYMQKLGLSDYELAETFDRICQTENEEGDTVYHADGYSFCFVPAQNDIQGICAMHKWYARANENGNLDVAGSAYQEGVIVHVNSSGIDKIDIGQLYDEKKCTEEHPNMISFEQVQEVVREFIETGFEDTGAPLTMYVDNIRLQYMSVRYGENYAIVPVWIYYNRGEGAFSEHYLPTIWMAINALDGDMLFAYSDDEKDTMHDIYAALR